MRPGHGRAAATDALVGAKETRLGRVDSGDGGSAWAQQPEQRQLQRARAAPRNPAERVGVSAGFASMPTRTPVHSSTVNSEPGSWDVVHLIRVISWLKGLLSRFPGHMVRTAGCRPRRCDPVIRL